MVEARQAAWAPELKRKLELMPASSALPALFFRYDRDTLILLLLSYFAQCVLVIFAMASYSS